MEQIASRAYGRVYQRVRKHEVYEFVRSAVKTSGGQILYSSRDDKAPLFLGVEVGDGERLGILAYVFRSNRRTIRNRPVDEHRIQVRYGDVNSRAWREQEHPIARDIAGVDTTILIGADPEAGIVIGLDPTIYDPLPLGISIEFKQRDVDKILNKGWHVWERMNIAGSRRTSKRAPDGVETIVGFKPERMIDYVRFEREASDLGLDPPLRYSLAKRVGESPPALSNRRHVLEETFDLTAIEILDMIDRRHRLGVAVKGGVAELHLSKYLAAHPIVDRHSLIDQDDQPDFDVWLTDDTQIRIECKNASPERYANGEMKVEVQKTRGRAPERLYETGRFDVLAACAFASEGEWSFRFCRASDLALHDSYPGRIRPMQRVSATWSNDLADVLG